MIQVVSVVAYLLFAPFLGGLLDGVDRIISARMQGRKGPPLLQPFYDLQKLFTKQMFAVNSVQLLLNLSYLIFLAVAGCMLFAGADILMCLFVLTTADMFLIMAASSDSSPFSTLGAGREMIQMMAYEPLTLLMAVGFYLATGSFHVGTIITMPYSAVLFLPGMLMGFFFITAIKLRKSPFDLSTSHHAHQEMVKGITTEMAGPTFAIMNVAEYYEMILMLGLVALFFLNENWWSWPLAIAVCLFVYFLEILWDNVCARVKWRTLLDSCWIVTLLCGGLNLLILMLIH
ncbi:MAG TPA: NADH-quinone oxidoreductase subunit H [Candidatus Caccousia avicola]|uniref:NADH-quinone oxidoreductase subunit H n=1 Tax=Candidatus Caccousia avicola TaxID=2840721 RepID=A0A9D1ANW3_9FIRM|nr:NADH-quinone oxidoreductase subunit H [Candidatus Caccousia avicola]